MCGLSVYEDCSTCLQYSVEWYVVNQYVNHTSDIPGQHAIEEEYQQLQGMLFQRVVRESLGEGEDVSREL